MTYLSIKILIVSILILLGISFLNLVFELIISVMYYLLAIFLLAFTITLFIYPKEKFLKFYKVSIHHFSFLSKYINYNN